MSVDLKSELVNRENYYLELEKSQDLMMIPLIITFLVHIERSRRFWMMTRSMGESYLFVFKKN